MNTTHKHQKDALDDKEIQREIRRTNAQIVFLIVTLAAAVVLLIAEILREIIN